jgi:hypothetical protein
VLAMLTAMGSRDSGQVFVSGLFFAGILGVIYLLQRKIVITVETTGGMIMGLSFKPSVIENVSINVSKALEVIECINNIVVTKSRDLPA